jgi:hypothetical protein
MTDYPDPDPDFPQPVPAFCLRNQQVAAEFRTLWHQAIANRASKDDLLGKLEGVRKTPLGDALQEMSGVDLRDYREHLNGIPDGPRQDLVNAAVDALNKGLDARFSLAHSGQDVTAAEVRKWYRNSDATTPALVEFRLICPSP